MFASGEGGKDPHRRLRARDPARRCFRAVLLLGLALLAGLTRPVEAVEVVVTIPPLHSLAAGVMKGAGEPRLLLSSGSPHTYQMRPSDARALVGAELVVWVGPELETFLIASLEELPKKARKLGAASLPGLTLLHARQGLPWEEEEHGAHAGEGHEHQGGIDPHLWLDPENAMAIVDRLARELAVLDPPRAELYRQNGEETRLRLRELARDLEKAFLPLRRIPFLVFHDAYQYLERRFGLHGVGALTLHPDQPLSAWRVREAGKILVGQSGGCLFREPQFPSGVVESLANELGTGSGQFDPMGAEIPPGPELYFAMMRRFPEAFRQCRESRVTR